jgi:drug/metabolite transporter (DMT)-like permease
MVAFASNSLLCRVALLRSEIDPASFTSIRLASGTLVLWLIVFCRSSKIRSQGNWPSALALFTYAAGFSFAYVQLTTATGALLLFAAVQTTMIMFGLWSGERLRVLQVIGLLAALGGLLALLMPGVSAPSLDAAVLMLGAGVAWGIYSLRGKKSGDPTSVTAANFMRAVPISLLLSMLMVSNTSVDLTGSIYAVASGAIASGIGYAIWYTALPGLRAIHAATVQLSVPVITALGGVVFLAEPITLRLLFASVTILGGIALVLINQPPRQNKDHAAQ